LSKKVKKEDEEEEEEPEETSLARPDGFTMMDMADEQAIEKEFEGIGEISPEKAKSLVYVISDFPPALSILGVREIIRSLCYRGKIKYRIKNKEVILDEKNVYVNLTIHEKLSGQEYVGAAQCEKNDRFAIVKAVNKAERNALRKLLPEKEMAKFIAKFMKEGKVRKLPSVARPGSMIRAAAAPLPVGKPVTKPEAKTVEADRDIF
jgi:hypothetical protein